MNAVRLCIVQAIPRHLQTNPHVDRFTVVPAAVDSDTIDLMLPDGSTMRTDVLGVHWSRPADSHAAQLPILTPHRPEEDFT